MKLTRIETFTNEFVGFVRVTTEDGARGWGQVSTYHSDITCQVLHRQVAPWVLGQDTDDLDNLLDIVTEREHKFPGSYLRRAMGGLDTAVWDMRGKQAGKPVATFAMDGHIRFASAADRAAFTEELSAAVTELVARHHTARPPGTTGTGKLNRLVIAVHPAVPDTAHGTTHEPWPVERPGPDRHQP